MTTKKLELLIVEDGPQCLDAARQYFATQDTAMDYASTLKEAREKITAKRYDAVLTDICIPAVPERIAPISYSMEYLKLLQEMGEVFGRAIETGMTSMLRASRYEECLSQLMCEAGKSNVERPLGLFVVQILEQKKIPYVIVTSGHHHQMAYEPVTGYLIHKYGKTPYDNKDIIESADKTKPETWEKAFDALKKKLY